jgi:transcriptional regulator GlxA family with amidase domain
LRLRDAFFRHAGIDPRQFLQAFDHVPGLSYFVKDAQSRTMLNTREYAQLPDHPSDETIVGKRPGEYLARDLAEHYETDDRKVLETGQPLRNIIEIITDKFPLRDAAGRVVGIMGTMQSLEGRIQNLPHLGEVGKAAAYIRANLGKGFLLIDVADHVGFSERQLQRLFHRLVGMTIHQFIIHSRVHAAAYELTHSSRALAEIAMMFGFTDQAAFTNTFRRATGTPPREYRSRHARASSEPSA